MSVYDDLTRKPSYRIAPLAGVGVALLLVLGLSVLWMFNRNPVYELEVSNARGLAAGDAVVLNGVRVGQVLSTDASGRGASVRFRMEGGEQLQEGDLLRVTRGVLSATSEIRITRPCGADPERPSLPRTARLSEASLPAVAATQFRCSAAGRQVSAWVEGFEVEDAVEQMRGIISDLAVSGQESGSLGMDFLREQSQDLIARLEQAGMRQRADSIRRLLEAR